MVVPWWYQSRTRVVPVRFFCYLLYSCLVPVLYLSGTYWHLCGTCAVPMWYMCGTCPDRPEQVDKLLHDLGRSLYIARWQYYFVGTWWVPLSHQCGTWVAPMLLLFGISAASV